MITLVYTTWHYIDNKGIKIKKYVHVQFNFFMNSLLTTMFIDAGASLQSTSFLASMPHILRVLTSNSPFVTCSMNLQRHVGEILRLSSYL